MAWKGSGVRFPTAPRTTPGLWSGVVARLGPGRGKRVVGRSSKDARPINVDFFLLEDLVTNEGGVAFLMPFDDFRPPSVPTDSAAYTEYRRRSIEFIEARNDRIARLNV